MTTKGLALTLLALSACHKASAPPVASGTAVAGVPGQAGPLSLEVPRDAVAETPASPMRLGQWKLPRAAGDGEDAQLLVFFFGAGQGGTPAVNLQRWCAQFTDEGGAAACQQSQPLTSAAHGLTVTRVAYRGRYKAMDMLTNQDVDKPNQELLAAIVESPKGMYFIKLLGPEATVAAQHAFFEQRLLPSLALRPDATP
jgi:hypothetical protein